MTLEGQREQLYEPMHVNEGLSSVLRFITRQFPHSNLSSVVNCIQSCIYFLKVFFIPQIQIDFSALP